MPFAGAWLAQPGDDPQQGRLAAARGAKQAQKLAAADVEIDPIECRNPAREALGDAAEPDDRRGWRRVAIVFLPDRQVNKPTLSGVAPPLAQSIAGRTSVVQILVAGNASNS
jgi:hypothetical protein